MKSDISQGEFYIKNLANVLKGQRNDAGKVFHVKNRQFDVFTYVLSGSCSYRIDGGGEFSVNKGDIMFLSRNESYSIHIHEDYQFIFCDFVFCGEKMGKSNVYTPKNKEYAENVFTKLLYSHSNHSKTSFCECMALVYEIYAMITEAANRDYVARFARNKVSEIKLYIDSDYKNPALCVNGLAQMAGISEVYLRKIFKMQYGISPSQYITNVRINKAKEFMKYPLLSLEECALQSGFSSLQYFSRVFKKTMGTTPFKYRNKNQKYDSF